MWILKKTGKLKMPDGSYKLIKAGEPLPEGVELKNPDLWCIQAPNPVSKKELKSPSDSKTVPKKSDTSSLPRNDLDLDLEDSEESEGLLAPPTKAGKQVKKETKVPKFVKAVINEDE